MPHTRASTLRHHRTSPLSLSPDASPSRCTTPTPCRSRSPSPSPSLSRSASLHLSLLRLRCASSLHAHLLSTPSSLRPSLLPLSLPPHGLTALHLAALRGHAPLLALAAELLPSAAISAPTAFGATPLHLAAARAPALVGALAALGGDVEARARSGASPLVYAAWAGGVDAVEAVLAVGGSVHARCADGSGVLHAAVMGRSGGAAGLGDEGGNCESDGEKKEGEQRDVDADKAAIVKRLVQAGAKVSAVDGGGRGVVLAAVEADGGVGLVKALVAAGASVGVRDWRRGWSAVSAAARMGRPEVLRECLGHCAPAAADAVDRDGFCPVVLATMEGGMGGEKCVQVLVDAGCDLTGTDWKGRGVVWWAAEKGRIGLMGKVVEACQVKGVGVDEGDEDGITPLMVASERGFDKVVSVLLDAGAEVDRRDHRGVSVREKAARAGRRQVLKLLDDAVRCASVNEKEAEEGDQGEEGKENLEDGQTGSEEIVKRDDEDTVSPRRDADEDGRQSVTDEWSEWEVESGLVLELATTSQPGTVSSGSGSGLRGTSPGKSGRADHGKEKRRGKKKWSVGENEEQGAGSSDDGKDSPGAHLRAQLSFFSERRRRGEKNESPSPQSTPSPRSQRRSARSSFIGDKQRGDAGLRRTASLPWSRSRDRRSPGASLGFGSGRTWSRRRERVTPAREERKTVERFREWLCGRRES